MFFKSVNVNHKYFRGGQRRGGLTRNSAAPEWPREVGRAAGAGVIHPRPLARRGGAGGSGAGHARGDRRDFAKGDFAKGFFEGTLRKGISRRDLRRDCSSFLTFRGEGYSQVAVAVLGRQQQVQA